WRGRSVPSCPVGAYPNRDLRVPRPFSESRRPVSSPAACGRHRWRSGARSAPSALPNNDWLGPQSAPCCRTRYVSLAYSPGSSALLSYSSPYTPIGELRELHLREVFVATG